VSRESRIVSVPEGLAGVRVDAGIAKLLGISRTMAAESADQGWVLVNGSAVGKSDRLNPGDMLEVEWDSPRTAQIVPIEVPDMTVLHEEDDFVVVDKPVGVAAHPSVGWEGPTVLGALAAAGVRVSTSGQPERKGIVHRLDAGTSGVMAVAKSEHAYSVLKRAFRNREVEKVYHAAVQGHPDPLAGTIDAPIGRHPGSAWKFAVTREGKPSITHYETLEAFRRGSLLEVHLETGRTHQIRVHMSAQRHPCIGDPLYGADPVLAAKLDLERQWLHAMSLAFAHPKTGERVEFVSQYPTDLQHALDLLREGVD